jgi:LysM repeat protein
LTSRTAIAACAALAGCMLLGSPALAQNRAPTAPDLGELGIHIVKRGETLFTIARRYDLRTDELARLNATRPGTVLWPGRELWIPLAKAVNARAGVPAESAIPAPEPEPTTDDGPGSEAADGQTAAGVPDTYTVARGDTLYGISRRFGVSVEDLKRWNGLPADGSLLAGETLVLAGGSSPPPRPARRGGATRYTVQPGDTLSGIARRFGTTVAALKASNGLYGDQIRVGQVLDVSGLNAAPVGSAGPKRIEIDVSEQRMYVWAGGTLIWRFVVSTGMAGYPTRRGSFAVQSKIPNAWSSPWQLWMPNWLGIYWAGSTENGIHALPVINGRRLWGGNLGTPISYGCIVLGTQEAEMLYNWADLGTPVIVRD